MMRMVGAWTWGIWGVLLLAGCASSPGQVGDPWDRLDKPGVNAERRALAVAAAWREVVSGAAPAESGMDRVENLYWDPTTPVQVRLAIIEALSSDPDVERREAGLAIFRMSLPFEIDARVIAYTSAIAAEQRREDFTTALVRSLSRPSPHVMDADRQEAKALRTIHADRSLSSIAEDVVLKPLIEAGNSDPDLEDRIRADAWELLSRLDPDGSRRMALLDEAGGIPLFAAAAAAQRSLGVLASTREELAWIKRAQAPENAGWLDEVRLAIAASSVRDHGPLAMRNLEPIRLAAKMHAEWLTDGRDELIRQIRDRLATRQTVVRTTDPPIGLSGRSERLADIEPRLSFADALTILVIDETLADAGLTSSLLEAARVDRADRSTEHGGMMRWDAERPLADTYLPRPSERVGDDRFVASPELIEESSTALAHFHFHAREASLRSYAGPSRADLDYASHFSRTCVVFTSVSSRLLDADVYLPGDLRLDLGLIPRP
ncbi:MAG: hypothetical protein H6811_11050 [Phycisphaeraceae bacterium]|nr:hypothetical protein [Phycisphaeraceae bacterium]